MKNSFKITSILVVVAVVVVTFSLFHKSPASEQANVGVPSVMSTSSLAAIIPVPIKNYVAVSPMACPSGQEYLVLESSHTITSNNSAPTTCLTPIFTNDFSVGALKVDNETYKEGPVLYDFKCGSNVCELSASPYYIVIHQGQQTKKVPVIQLMTDTMASSSKTSKIQTSYGISNLQPSADRKHVIGSITLYQMKTTPEKIGQSDFDIDTTNWTVKVANSK